MTAPVVVGVDTVDRSWPAVAAAVREARLRDAPLWLAHSYSWLAPVAPGLMAGADSADAAMQDAATELLATAVSRVRAAFPDVESHGYAMSGAVAKGLADLAREASLLVVGGRGRGGFRGALRGSVAPGVVARARCPVMIVRGDGCQATDRVTVGVDLTESDGDPRALAVAFEESALRGAEVWALNVWEDPFRHHPAAAGWYLRGRLDAVAADRNRRMDAAVAPWREKNPGIPVVSDVIHGATAKALVEATGMTDVLVVGGRRHGNGAGRSISGLLQAVLHHARCPVVIVPGH